MLSHSIHQLMEKKHGCFGEVGIFSTSLLKVPTTLGGGFIVTENSELVKFINKWTDNFLKKAKNRNILKFQILLH